VLKTPRRRLAPRGGGGGMSEYQQFLASKVLRAAQTGIEPADMPDAMKPHQCDATMLAIKRGRSGLFLDTGLGKTFCELEFAAQASEATNECALILTPLAVAKQIEREAKRFAYDARVIREQSQARPGINICNYDRLDKLSPDAFGAVILDESSILKSFTGKTTRALIDAFAGHRFRLAATATPAPNDHMELGNHSEFLGIMSGNEMLSRFFINDTSTASQEWRLKGHAEAAFWDWMASWACMAESPADFGHDASEYILPPLEIKRHQAIAGIMPHVGDGLFAGEVSATHIHDLKRQTTAARADAVAELASSDKEPWVIWCDTNYESDALQSRMKDAVDVRGSMSIEEKEEALEAFAAGQVVKIISKPSICGFGVNWQHCARMAFVGRSFSYETWYQAIRRCWRFGQKRAVHVHLAVAEGEDQIGRVINRKSDDHAKMKRAMADAMRRALGREHKTKIAYDPHHHARLPSWLKSVA
jgi:superfamily II DNA or RNA helicase